MANKIIVNTKNKKNPLGDFYGIFFEDLNHAADGGLYAEMVRNRSFEFSPVDNGSYRSMTSWEKVGNASVMISDKEPHSAKNPHYAVVQNPDNSEGGLLNLGYNSGFNFVKGEEYIFTCTAKSNEGTTVYVSLKSIEGTVYAEKEFTINSGTWQSYKLLLSPTDTDHCGRLTVTMRSAGKICLDNISLFPKNTYKNRENGLRRDIALLLEDLKPKFMRFPGGCLIHDGSLNSDDRDSMYRWKNTIGPLCDRPARRSNWAYNQSLGLGYYEYFLFCEDIGAKPLPVLPAAYNPHSGQGAPFDELGEWIDDTLDLIEFARGGEDTKWGAVRASLGHKEPFGLEYIAIGNEEVGDGFFERYPYFHKAIKEKYPDIKIINSAGPFAAGGEYDKGWKSAADNGSDIIDEHYYMSPEWFLANVDRYNGFGKRNTKVFLGEYATWGNTYYNALSEAAYMTALENNSDGVALVCYAPLLCNVDYVNWKPDMIWFNNHTSYGSANYYVQKMFMTNLGTHLLDFTTEGLGKTQVLGSESLGGKISLTAERCTADFYDITITDTHTGKTASCDNIIGAQANKQLEIGSINSDTYEISFKAKRHSGTQGFKLTFGETDKDNSHSWVLGGWANADNALYSLIDGRSSCLIQNIFSVVTGLEYSFKLVINGRRLTGYINGEKTIEITDNNAVVRELYTTASIDEETGEIIVKAVNVMNSECVCDIVLDGINAFYGKAFQLAGYEKDDENTFDEPQKVFPVEIPVSSDSNTLSCILPPMSVTVYRVKEK